jgi:hypothetical protein
LSTLLADRFGVTLKTRSAASLLDFCSKKARTLGLMAALAQAVTADPGMACEVARTVAGGHR